MIRISTHLAYYIDVLPDGVAFHQFTPDPTPSYAEQPVQIYNAKVPLPAPYFASKQIEPKDVFIIDFLPPKRTLPKVEAEDFMHSSSYDLCTTKEEVCDQDGDDDDFEEDSTKASPGPRFAEAQDFMDSSSYDLCRPSRRAPSPSREVSETERTHSVASYTFSSSFSVATEYDLLSGSSSTMEC